MNQAACTGSDYLDSFRPPICCCCCCSCLLSMHSIVGQSDNGGGCGGGRESLRNDCFVVEMMLV